MSGQLIAALVFVGMAGVFVLRSLWQSIAKGGGATGCGKCTAKLPETSRPGAISLPRVDNAQ